MSDSGTIINLNDVRRGGQMLGDLLNLLYPPPPNPDIITLEDVLIRYRLTGLGAPAITALQQAQRIIRAGKDYTQIGLCEFHIGLIYLYGGYCLAAAQQFAEARRQWLFADETASVCLSFFAQGQAQHLVFHYEPAMGCYHKTEHYLPRLKLSSPSARLDDFIPKITVLLKEAQATLRDKMWPPDEPEREGAASEPTPEPATADPPPGAAEPTTADPSAENIVEEMRTPSEDFTEPSDVPPPIIFPTHASPTSALLTTREYYEWYRVSNRHGDFLPFVQEGEWILVDTRGQAKYEPHDLIIIGGKQNELNGSIPVCRSPQPTRIGLLTRMLQPSVGIPFQRDVQTGKVTLVLDTGTETIRTDNILGVVVGFWLTSLQAGWEETQNRP